MKKVLPPRPLGLAAERHRDSWWFRAIEQGALDKFNKENS